MPSHNSGITPRRPRLPLSFDHLVADSEGIQGVSRDDIAFGDRVIVYTLNSVYTLRRVDAMRFEVSGGWFDRQGGPATVPVTGCTWGGSAVRRDLVAGCGMRIEFGNRVLTSVVQRVVHYPTSTLN